MYKPGYMPTDTDVLSYDNVPIDIAAQYIGKTPEFVRCGLIARVLPLGGAVEMPGGKYSYSISPGLLVAYKRGPAAESIIASAIA